ncbi:DUF4160 domain-containing protein [candidate division KSB1 bacterium]|nr:DUF4160 domain-containing protein [candidate division KSB1 bacterium]
MPKLYEYLGLEVLFYADEHEPIHVHGRYQDSEIKAELVVDDNSEVVEIRFKPVRGKKSLKQPHLSNFKKLLAYKADEIVQKWNGFFVHGRQIKLQRITRRLK